MNRDEVLRGLRNAGGADWVRAMQQHYSETGTYRVEDLRRLLGDPMRGVSFCPDFASPHNAITKGSQEHS
jgi:hypothetical protein